MEVLWAITLKTTVGWKRVGPSLATAVVMILSTLLLAISVEVLPVGTAYAAWSGIGAAGVALFGILFLREGASAIRLGCILLIILGVAGLQSGLA
jgi:quaternary ammonium compound-resistance protein SugE